ncbi:hypothetical protein AB0M38_07165 [Streptomyces sp. NPDC051742]|uniref:hypothetical protein n=1 Tax=unclassified Streptomyces TaxID=2593676 RepID=UPI00341EADDF
MSVTALALVLSLPTAATAAPGDLDPAFDGDGRVVTDLGGFAGAQGMVVQPDGEIVTIGDGYSTETSGDFTLTRYNPNGSLDTTFDGDGAVTTDFGVNNDQGRGVALQPDGKIVAVGGSTDYGGNSAATTNRGTCTVVPGQVTCAVGTLNTAGSSSGSTATVTILAEPSRTGTLTDTATVTAAQTDPLTSNNTATRVTTVNNNRGCTIIGTSGSNTINGTYKNDVICALSGNDTVNASFGNDTVHAGPGNDRADGSYGNDTLIGGPGGDTLLGSYGSDLPNTVDGIGGNDTANGGYNTDTCTTDSGDIRVSCP